MTFHHEVQHRRGLGERDRATLARLETVKQPSDYDRGTLDALLRHAVGEDANRAALIAVAWGGP